ncbi:MAG TPA: DUF6089 family protein [Chitinophagaceae bacterium]
MNQKIFIVLVAMACGFTASAQSNVAKYEIGISLSSFLYQGDLTPEKLGASKTMRLGVNLFGTRILSSSVSLRTNLSIGGLRGDDSKYDNPEFRQQRNFKFRSRLFELSQYIVWNPLKKNYDDKGFYPYFFTGAGLGFVKIKRDWSEYNAEYFISNDVTARLAEDSAHSLPKVVPFIPLGAGLRLNVSSRWAINVESTYRFLFTDYLDGFSKAANPDKNDKYHSLSIGAIYRIGKRSTLSCPTVRL